MDHYMNNFESYKKSVNLISISKDSVICPKPRRLGCSNQVLDEPLRSLRYSHQEEISDFKEGREILDIFLRKGEDGLEQSPFNFYSSSPPFFSGSPPSRTSNPLIHDPFFSGSPPSRASNPMIQDVLFVDEKLTQFSALPAPLPIPSVVSPSPSSSITHKGGCARSKFGHKPATIRIEGFNCLDRDGRNCNISAVA